MNAGVDDYSMVVAIVFALALAVLACAVFIIRHMVRRKDVLHRGHIEDKED